MTVRNATFEDMALAADIMVTSFRTAFAEFVSPKTMDACTNPENCLCLLEHVYQEEKMHFLMGGDQGFLCWQETEDGAEIVAIHSLPESWGNGLGRAMLTEALKQIGDRPVYLWAFKENTRARRFYEKHGFRWDGSQRVSEFDGALEVRYVRNLTRKETADYLLYDCGLLEELTKYGKVHPIGSYRMDMMAWNDLDLDVENDGMSLEKLYHLTAFILEKFQPVWYEAKEEIAPDGKTVWFHGFETMITGQLWNVDIWFFDKVKIEAATDYCDSIARQTTPEQKRQIVAIKEELIRRGLYSFEVYRSIDVYKAVTELGITTPERFLSEYRIQRD